MEKEIREVAQRLRALREIEEIGEEEMAAALGKTPAEYRRYENGEEDFPFSFLYTAAGKLKVDLTDLLTGEGARLRVYSLVRRGGGLTMERRAAYNYRHLAPIFKHRVMEPFMVRVEPGKPGAAVEKNSHAGQEINYMVRGSMTLFIGGNSVLLHEGDLVYFDAAQPHAMRAEGGAPCEFLAVVSRQEALWL
jgi:quercetin dioxygenase-like cupin family protein